MDNAPIGQTIADMTLRPGVREPGLCALSGYTADELAGVNFRDFVHPTTSKRPRPEFDALKNAPQSHLSTELRVIGWDGETHWVQRNAVVVPGRTAPRT